MRQYWTKELQDVRKQPIYFLKDRKVLDDFSDIQDPVEETRRPVIVDKLREVGFKE